MIKNQSFWNEAPCSKTRSTRLLAVLLPALASAVIVLPSAQAEALTATVGSAITDMGSPHVAAPNGVPSSYSWQKGPIIQAGNRPPSSFRALTGWGQVYRATGAAPVTRKILLRNFRTYILTDTDELKLVQSPSSLGGSMFNSDYKDNINKRAQIQNGPDGITSVITDPAKSFQFWPSLGKTTFDPGSLKGVIVAVEAKLEPMATDNTGPDAGREYILSVGADYWLTTQSKWDNYRSSAGVATGRFNYITTSWKCFTMTTITGQSASILKSKFAC